jgi:hypothetical protein
MRNVFTILMFVASFIMTILSGFSMVYEVFRPVILGPNFAVSAIAFLLSAVLFLFIRHELEF